MLYKREDGIFEIECNSCQMRLTEVIEGDMPLTGQSAMSAGLVAGWEILPAMNLCAGCANVSK